MSDETLERAREALERAGFPAMVIAPDGAVVSVTQDLRQIFAAGGEVPEIPLGAHLFSERWVTFNDTTPGGPTLDSQRRIFRDLAPGLATDFGGVDALRDMVDPRLHDLLEGVEPAPPQSVWSGRVEVNFGDRTTPIDLVTVRLHDDGGRAVGAVTLSKPGLSGVLVSMLATGDAALFERMLSLTQPARRPTAILFADLESSTALSRRLSTRGYFSLVRRLAWRADSSAVRAGAVIGKHVGDGITAFFLAETAGSESAAARACIEAAQAMRADAADAAERSGLAAEEVVLRIGLHWGATVYIGRLLTSGRAEVTALGDEVNEAARIEACATGGRTLASKQLVERLDPGDAHALGLDPADVHYTALADLPGAPEKARRDAPALSVASL